MAETEENERITQTWIGRHYMWDRMSDVQWDMVESGLAGANRVLNNLAKFPNADIEFLETSALEHELFLLRKPISFRALALAEGKQ